MVKLKNGPYILVIAPKIYPGKKYRNKYVYEHHLVWWQNTGEIITANFAIHHKNENKHDNSFSNLEKLSWKEHGKRHAKKVPLAELPCSWCKNLFKLNQRNLHFKTKAGQVNFYCNKSCQGKASWINRPRKNNNY